MKQTNKMRRVVSAALFCTSLFLLTGITGCSKDVVNEETPISKGMPGGDGTSASPFLPGRVPTFDVQDGNIQHYFKLGTGSQSNCSFLVVNPAKTNVMTFHVTMSMIPGPRKLTFRMQRISDDRTIAAGYINTTSSSSSIDIHMPENPAPPGIIDYPLFPTEQVKINIQSSVEGLLGVKFSYSRVLP